MSKTKEQFNARVPKGFKRAVVRLSTRLGYTAEDALIAAFSDIFRCEDPEIQARRKKLADTAQEMSLSFSQPNFQLSLDLAA